MRTGKRLVNRDWFKRVQGEFHAAIEPFIGKPICYVEVGVWRGGSAKWVLENVLTDECAIGLGIDPYLAGHNYDQKLADEVHAEMVDYFRTTHKFFIVRDASQNALRTWRERKIDFLYLDGAHDAHSIMLDFAYAWPHLKEGSVIQFDDWGIGHRKGPYHVPAAVAAIQQAFGRFVEPIGRPTLQYTLRVKEYPQLGAICK